jgi:hypothetical protein
LDGEHVRLKPVEEKNVRDRGRYGNGLLIGREIWFIDIAQDGEIVRLEEVLRISA